MHTKGILISINILLMEQANPFSNLLRNLEGHPETSYYSITELNDARVPTLPYSIRVLLESALRNCDEFNIKSKK